MGDDKSDDSIEAGITLSPDGSVTGANVKLGRMQRIFEYTFPDRAARVRLTKATVDGISRKLREGGGFSALSDEEEAIALHFLGEKVEALVRRAQIVERAEAAIPELEVRLLRGQHDEAPPENMRPDNDWLRKFWADAELIGSEEMQELYARILAGEGIKPGSFSLRTLDVVRTLDQQTAKLFSTFVNHSVGGLLPAPGNEPTDFLGLDFRDFAELVEAGLVDGEQCLTKNFSARFGTQLLRAEHPGPEDDPFAFKIVQAYTPTRAGRELTRVAHLVRDYDYFEVFVDWLRELGFAVSVKEIHAA